MRYGEEMASMKHHQAVEQYQVSFNANKKVTVLVERTDDGEHRNVIHYSKPSDHF